MRTRLSLVIVAALAAGAVAGAAAALLVLELRADARGHVVRLGTQLGYQDGAYCDDLDHYCIPEPKPGEDLTAFYTFTTHDVFRQRRCSVTWRPGAEQAIHTGSEDGAFRGGCDGSTFDRTGRRVFGPAPRDLDRFRVTTTSEGIFVDTRTLICGAPAESCKRSPRPD